MRKCGAVITDQLLKAYIHIYVLYKSSNLKLETRRFAQSERPIDALMGKIVFFFSIVSSMAKCEVS